MPQLNPGQEAGVQDALAISVTIRERGGWEGQASPLCQLVKLGLPSGF